MTGWVAGEEGKLEAIGGYCNTQLVHESIYTCKTLAGQAHGRQEWPTVSYLRSILGRLDWSLSPSAGSRETNLQVFQCPVLPVSRPFLCGKACVLSGQIGWLAGSLLARLLNGGRALFQNGEARSGWSSLQLCVLPWSDTIVGSGWPALCGPCAPHQAGSWQ